MAAAAAAKPHHLKLFFSNRYCRAQVNGEHLKWLTPSRVCRDVKCAPHFHEFLPFSFLFLLRRRYARGYCSSCVIACASATEWPLREVFHASIQSDTRVGITTRP